VCGKNVHPRAIFNLNRQAEIKTRYGMTGSTHPGPNRKRLGPHTLAVITLTARSGHLWAEGTSPDFQFDPVEYWAARILTWVLVLAVILVVYTLVKAVRGQLGGNKGRALMLAGVVLLPSFSVVIGMLLVFTRAKRVEFCASCHRVMQDYAHDMTNSDGRGLAAIHFANRYIPKNQCYECHTSYGLFGTVEAKIHGIGEVAKYYTGLYDPPVTMWRPYRNADCLKCHAESNKWLSVEAHTDEETEAELFADRTSCMSCHGSAHHVKKSAEMADL
jgi:nitrate/TMAO reductase-like tetraheme cytochrome c subunit